MASDFFKRAGQFLGLVEEYEDEYADMPPGEPLGPPDVDAEPPAPPRPEPSNVRRIPTAGRVDDPVGPPAQGPPASPYGPAAAPPPATPSGTVNVLGGPSRPEPPASSGPRVVDRVHVTSPSAFNDVEEVGEHFRDGDPVLMNLQGASEGVAKRLLDFASGLIYGLDGSIERTGDRIFLLTPDGVDIATIELDRLRDRGLVQ